MLDDQQLSYGLVSDLLSSMSVMARFHLEQQNEFSQSIPLEDHLPSLQRLCRIAQTSNLPDFILGLLATHPAWEVREAVSDNPGLSSYYLLRLARDIHPDVRYAIAENHRTPAAVLAEMCEEDHNPYVSHRAGQTLQRLQATSFFSSAKKTLELVESNQLQAQQGHARLPEAI